MIMPVRQRCPSCGMPFMGSDAIGGICSTCSGRRIYRGPAPKQVPKPETELQTERVGCEIQILDAIGVPIPNAQVCIADSTGLKAKLECNIDGFVQVPFLMVKYLNSLTPDPKTIPVETLPVTPEHYSHQQEIMDILRRHREEIIRVFSYWKKP